VIAGNATRLLPGGETLVRVDGQSVLVANAVPGDTVKLRMLDKRRGTQRAEIVDVIEASARRVNALCPVAAECGGCALQFISEEYQAEVKSGWVKDAFNSLMDANTDWMPVCSGGERYRRRVRWFIGHDEQGRFLGFYAPASHRPVRHTDCPVVRPVLNEVRRLIEDGAFLEDINSIQAVQLHDGIHIIVEAATRPDQIETDAITGIKLQWWWRDAHHITRPLQKPVQSFHDLLPAGENSVLLTVGPDDFVQGQAEGNRELIGQVQAWAGSVSRIADLFCGIGNLSLPLAAATGADVFGAELNAASVRAALRNANALGISAHFVVANLFENFDMEPYIGADVLILDPPRRGAKRLCNQMSQLLPKKIIMISCDTAAGARDGALLQQHGYRLMALRGLDLFPGAGHVETMSLWEPA